MKFYLPDGSETNIDEFIDFYNKAYYLNNNSDVENYIDKLLLKPIKNRDDFQKILAWKVGTIDHRKTTSVIDENGTIKIQWKYKGNNSDNFISTRYQVLDLESILNLIADNENIITKKPIEILSLLNSFQGIGPVYAITILYFITKGKYPIYDKFADVAIKAIISESKPNDEIIYKGITEPDKKGTYKKFITQIDNVFSYERYMQNRNIDRALWTYGHLFNIK